MLKAPIPVDEEQRLEDLRRLDLLLATPEAAFDSVIEELARIFEVPGVMMSFTDRDTQYFKSAVTDRPIDFGAGSVGWPGREVAGVARVL